jgi:threonine/homoserine/homoserine lactone efflux protein
MSPAPIQWHAIGPLVLAALAIMGSPGPATISLTACGSAYGIARSSRYLAGIVLGTIVVLVAVATGVTAVLLTAPAVRPALLVISALYILRLAYLVATAPPPERLAAGRPPTLAGGLLLGVANPKAWVAIAAVVAGAHVSRGPVTDGVVKVAVLVALIVVINVSWLAAGAVCAPALQDPRRARAINVGLAILLVGAMAAALLGS